MGGLFHCMEPWEDGLRLDRARAVSGCCCLPVVDGGENGFPWGRVVVEAELPPDTALRVYAYASDRREWGDWSDLDQGLRALEEQELVPVLREVFGPPAAESGDFYVQKTGRYLWLMLELAAAGPASPSVRKVRIFMGGDHMVDYLPAIYQEDGFTRRFLSIFNSILLDMEREITTLPQRLDYESADLEMLSYLAQWVGIEEQDAETLRDRIATVLPDYETMYTLGGIRRSVRRLTGREPYLIEHFNVSPNAQECRDPELYRRLYGDDPNRFFVLLREGDFPSRRAMEDFQRRMERLIPARVSMELILLKPCIQLDWHTYLGINSRIGGYVPAALDENTTIHYDTTIGGAAYEA